MINKEKEQREADGKPSQFALSEEKVEELV